MHNRKFQFITTLVLFVTLILIRVHIRGLNELWVDELKELSGFKSLYFLFTDFLPTIPGGAPGDYLIIYPLQTLFPFNKYLLGLPGLLSHILVFLMLPKAIEKLDITEKNNLFAVSTIARLFFIFEPTLAFQSMEIRPYANVPFYWTLNIFIVSLLLKHLSSSSSLNRYSTAVIWILGLAAMFVWHYYMIIFFLSIFIFKLSQKEHRERLLHLKKFTPIVFAAIMVAFPFWEYFSSKTGAFPYNTMERWLVNIMQVYAIDKGFPRGIPLQNWIYFAFLLVMLCTLIFTAGKSVSDMRRHTSNRVYSIFWKIFIFLVLLPLAVILFLDLKTNYMFLYRQFVWINLPFYIGISYVIAEGFPRIKIRFSNDS